MDDFDIFDGELTAAEATLLVAAVADDADEDGGSAASEVPGSGRPVRPVASRRREAPSERRAAGGCAGCGCLLIGAGLGAVALAVASLGMLVPAVGPTLMAAFALVAAPAATLVPAPVGGSLASAIGCAMGGSAAGAARPIRASVGARRVVARPRTARSGRTDGIAAPTGPLAWFRPIRYSWFVPKRR